MYIHLFIAPYIICIKYYMFFKIAGALPINNGKTFKESKYSFIFKLT